MPRLSLCMIVRDEQAGLKRCLSSVAGLVDEIVVVDTGSKDGSWTIIKEMADVCQQIDWPNHFAKARNVSLSLAKGDWVLVLDGDEALVHGHEDVKMAIQQPDLLGAEIQIRNLLADDKTADFWGLRLFRRLPGVEFSGRIHEQVMPSLQRIMNETEHPPYRLDRVRAQIQHWGYLPDVQLSKDRKNRNISMLHSALADAADDVSDTNRAYLAYKLGRELGLDHPDGQLQLDRSARQVMSLTPAKRSSFALSAEILVAAGQIWLAQGDLHSAVDAAEAASLCLPHNPMVALLCAQAHYRLGHIAQAQAAVTLARNNQNVEAEFFFDDAVFDMALAKLESDLALRRNEPHAAVAVLRELCERREGNAQPQLWLLGAQLATGNAEAALRGGVTWMKKHGAQPAALMICADAAEALGMEERAQRWREMVRQQ